MSVSTLDDLLQRIAAGKGMSRTLDMVSAATTQTAAALASGLISGTLYYQVPGTTHLSTLVGFTLPPGTLPLLLTHALLGTGSSGMLYIERQYLIGTVNLTATGDRLSHNSAGFPALRTQFGQASQPLTLTPLFEVTTATSVTAPEVRFRTAAGADGYINQDGNSVVGTRTFTFPNAATGVASCYMPMLELGDSGVRDITNIEVVTASSTGAMNVWGVELLDPIFMGGGVDVAKVKDFLHGLNIPDLRPATPTSGSFTTHLCLYGNTSNNGRIRLTLNGVTNS